MSFIKAVRIPFVTGNGADLQFRVEAFNFLNTTNLDTPVFNLTDPLFGRSVSASPGRIIQFSGKIAF